jgi:hypothetical protein
MADMAYARRADVAPNDKGLPTHDRLAEEKGQKPATATTASSALSTIAAYIPTEILTVYVAVLATIGVAVPTSVVPGGSPGATGSPTASPSPASGAAAGGADPVTAASVTPIELYLLFLVLTPIIVWALYATRAKKAGKALPGSFASWPKWEMLAGTVAYAVWAAALPASPLGTFDWFNLAAAGVVALIASMVLGVVAPLFASNALADS